MYNLDDDYPAHFSALIITRITDLVLTFYVSSQNIGARLTETEFAVGFWPRLMTIFRDGLRHFEAIDKVQFWCPSATPRSNMQGRIRVEEPHAMHDFWAAALCSSNLKPRLLANLFYYDHRSIKGPTQRDETFYAMSSLTSSVS